MVSRSRVYGYQGTLLTSGRKRVAVWRTGIGDAAALDGVSMEAGPRDRGAMDMVSLDGGSSDVAPLNAGFPERGSKNTAFSALGFPRCMDPASLDVAAMDPASLDVVAMDPASLDVLSGYPGFGCHGYGVPRPRGQPLLLLPQTAF